MTASPTVKASSRSISAKHDGFRRGKIPEMVPVQACRHDENEQE
jgi:hypothetical protein